MKCWGRHFEGQVILFVFMDVSFAHELIAFFAAWRWILSWRFSVNASYSCFEFDHCI